MTEGKQDGFRQSWRGMRAYGTVGLEMGISVALGAGFGLWLDRKLGTGHLCTLIGLFFGIAAAGKALWRVVKQAQAEAAQEERDMGSAGRPAVRPPEGDQHLGGEKDEDRGDGR